MKNYLVKLGILTVLLQQTIDVNKILSLHLEILNIMFALYEALFYVSRSLPLESHMQNANARLCASCVRSYVQTFLKQTITRAEVLRVFPAEVHFFHAAHLFETLVIRATDRSCSLMHGFVLMTVVTIFRSNILDL